MENAEAFAELYRREGESVLIFLTRRTWDGETALELTAETFAVAIRSWRRLQPLAVEQQRAWLFTVARRQLSRYLRRAKVERRAVHRLGMQIPAVQADDLALIEQRAGLPELRQALARELARLTTTQQEALRMRVVEEQSYEAISSTLGITQQTARTRVSRALQALSSGLDARDTVRDGHYFDCSSPAQEGSS